MGNVSNQIDDIISKRKDKLVSLEKIKASVSTAYNSVSQFAAFQMEIKNNPEKFPMFKGNVDIIDRISEISTANFFHLYDVYTSELNRLICRLGRDSLNISFIGRAGQGKSLVMQNISGLDNSVIPSAKGSDCTGAKSIITNANVDSVEAEILFYSESEMVDIVNQYLLDLTKGRIKISRSSEIPSLNVDSIQSDAENRENANDGITELCENLRVYVDNYNKYKDCIGTTAYAKKDEIEQYVAHYSCSNSEIKYYKYLAVKLANIKTRFPHEDVGKVVLVDTIGIGKTALGVKEEMLKAVENDSDAIILILRPDIYRYSMDKEVEILKDIQERVGKEYTKEMLFWVLNRVEKIEESNSAGVIDIINKIKQRGYAIAKPLNVDCSSNEEVEHRLLIPVLEHLSSRITAVDEILIEKLNSRGNQLFQAFTTICQATDRAFASSANEDLKRKFYNRISPTIRTNILNALRYLYLTEYNDLRQSPCEDLMDAAEKKLKNISKAVPTREEVFSILQYGDVNQINAYEICTNIMRIRIIDDFTQLNNVLERLVEKMKMQVLHIFADENKGRLGLIYPLNCDSSTWIDSFLNIVEGEKNYPILTDSLRKFQAYTINVQGFLIHEVREQLDPIDISLPRKDKKDKSSNVPDIAGSLAHPEDIVEDIVEWLTHYAEQVRDNVQVALNDLYKTPNRSMFAAIKDLYDRITYTMANGQSKVAEEWRYLYEDWMHLIWKEEYQQESAIQVIAEQWNTVVESLKAVNNVECFTIKN